MFMTKIEESEGCSSSSEEGDKPKISSDINLRKSVIAKGEMDMIPEDAKEEEKHKIEEEEEEDVSSSYEDDAEYGEDEVENYSSSLLKKYRKNTGENRGKKVERVKMASSMFITSSQQDISF
jgi:hypothetical protein